MWRTVLAEEPVHYEVFIRRTVASGWSLELATEARLQALQCAGDALNETRAVGVKVTKESRQASGRYASVVILSKGDLEPPRRKGRASEESTAPLCVSPSDLYSLHARERIARLLEGWLVRQNATAFELLHRPDLVERLDAAGLELQHAVQKVAIPEAQATGASTHEIIRRYQKLVEAAVARLLGDGRKGVFPNLGRDGLAACLRRAQEASDPAYVLGATVAGVLAAEMGWTAKITRLLDIAESAGETPGRSLLLQVIEQPLAEILGGRAVLAEFLGGSPDLGGSLALMVRLVAPEVVEALARSDPGLARAIPPVAPEAARLARWLEEPAFEAVRAALGRRILAELHGPRRLHPDDPTAEIHTLRALARLLILSPRIASADDVQAAFVDRSRRLVGADFVQTYVEQCGGGAIGEAQALVRLAENVVGAANKRAAGAWLKAAVGSLRFERDLRAGAESPAAKLAQLAELQRSLARAGLEPEERGEVAAKLGAVADAVEIKSHLIASIARAPGGAAHRLLLLLRLASGDSVPFGPVTTRARAEVLKLVRDAGVRAELAAAQPGEMDRVRQMLQSAGLAA